MENEIWSERRDAAWIADRVRLIWENHLADVAKGYPITVRYGARAQYRFGSIAARSCRTVILLNRLFADPFVPTFVVDATIGHELVHYAHGFGSGLPRLYTDPHRGGIVDRELELRGLGEVTRKADQWRELNWDAYYNKMCADVVDRRDSRQDALRILWERQLCQPTSRSKADLDERLVIVAKQMSCRPPFTVEWLHATCRQNGTSYLFGKLKVVRLHGLLADRRVPAYLVEFEIAYWLARTVYGQSWQTVEAALRKSGFGDTMERALKWRKSSWPGFVQRNHPHQPAAEPKTK